MRLVPEREIWVSEKWLSNDSCLGLINFLFQLYFVIEKKDILKSAYKTVNITTDKLLDMSRNACRHENGENASKSTKSAKLIFLWRIWPIFAKIVKSINIQSVWRNVVKSAIFVTACISGHRWAFDNFRRFPRFLWHLATRGIASFPKLYALLLGADTVRVRSLTVNMTVPRFELDLSI